MLVVAFISCTSCAMLGWMAAGTSSGTNASFILEVNQCGQAETAGAAILIVQNESLAAIRRGSGILDAAGAALADHGGGETGGARPRHQESSLR